MGTVDEVGDLLAQGVSGAEIARRLGVSRQRVWQISKNLGFDRASKRRRAMEAASEAHAVLLATPYSPTIRPSIPRVNLPEGAARPASSMAVGAISEFLVAADLMARGFLVYMPVLPSRRHDLIGLRDDKMVTFEVRSGYRGKNNKLLFNKKASDDSAHYAIVITGEPVIYDPPIP